LKVETNVMVLLIPVESVPASTRIFGVFPVGIAVSSISFILVIKYHP